MTAKGNSGETLGVRSKAMAQHLPCVDGSILIADPFPAGQDLHRRFVEMNCEAYLARDFESTIALASRLKPVLVASELRLDDRSGIDLISQLRSMLPTARIVVATAYGSIEAARRAVVAGAADFFTKPISACEILGTLGHCETPVHMRRLSLDDARRQYVQELLSQYGSIAKTARALCVDRRQLRRLMARLGVERTGLKRALPCVS